MASAKKRRCQAEGCRGTIPDKAHHSRAYCDDCSPPAERKAGRIRQAKKRERMKAKTAAKPKSKSNSKAKAKSKAKTKR